MSGLWGEQMSAQYRDAKRKKREQIKRARRRRVNAVVHPVKSAKKRFLPW